MTKTVVRAKMILLFSALSALLIGGCVGNGGVDLDLNDIEESNRCPATSFDEVYSSHIVENKEVYLLREVTGVVRARTGIVFPEGSVLVQIRSLTDQEKEYSARSGVGGVFRIPRVPKGSYCYVIFIAGFQAEEGRLIVHSRAPARNAMDVTLILDH